jgi:hypothetical protein
VCRRVSREGIYAMSDVARKIETRIVPVDARLTLGRFWHAVAPRERCRRWGRR